MLKRVHSTDAWDSLNIISLVSDDRKIRRDLTGLDAVTVTHPLWGLSRFFNFSNGRYFWLAHRNRAISA